MTLPPYLSNSPCPFRSAYPSLNWREDGNGEGDVGHQHVLFSRPASPEATGASFTPSSQVDSTLGASGSSPLLHELSSPSNFNEGLGGCDDDGGGSGDEMRMGEEDEKEKEDTPSRGTSVSSSESLNFSQGAPL